MGTALLSRTEQLRLISCHRLRRALARVDAGPEGSNRVVWTSLREVRFVKTLSILNLMRTRNLSSTLLGALTSFV